MLKISTQNSETGKIKSIIKHMHEVIEFSERGDPLEKLPWESSWRSCKRKITYGKNFPKYGKLSKCFK